LGLRDVVLELLQPIAHFPSGCLASHGGSKLWILRIVATGADRILLHSQELVAGLSRFVGAVARSTPRQPRLLELVLHACFREQLGDLAVAGAAGIGNRVHARRHGTVIAMAIIAGGSAQVPFLEQRPTVN